MKDWLQRLQIFDLLFGCMEYVQIPIHFLLLICFTHYVGGRGTDDYGIVFCWEQWSGSLECHQMADLGRRYVSSELQNVD